MIIFRQNIIVKALKLLNDEVPHGIYVEVSEMKTKKTKDNNKFFDIKATIYCLRESHKGIIIGKNGSMLKKIGTFSREDLERELDTKVNIKLWVKTNKDWTNNINIVNKYKNNTQQTERQETCMIKQIAWNTFKNTGDINTMLELIEVEKAIKNNEENNKNCTNEIIDLKELKN